MDCVFCKIADGEIPSDIIYEDQKVIAFNDLDPQAPIHFLVYTKGKNAKKFRQGKEYGSARWVA